MTQLRNLNEEKTEEVAGRYMGHKTTYPQKTQIQNDSLAVYLLSYVLYLLLQQFVLLTEGFVLLQQ